MKFWDRVNKRGDCWLWMGAVYKASGYGQVRPKGRKPTTAHRYAYELAYGSAPEGMDVCHRCDVRLCVRPSHLFAGSRQQNMQDAVKKGRQYHGARHHRARLAAQDVVRIRSGTLTVSQWARALGVHYETVRDAKIGRTWKAVGTEVVS